MIKFGSKPNPGTVFRASQFLAEELPVRLAHRVKELDELPENLNQMPSIKRVKEWYAQSFDVSKVLWLATTPRALCSSPGPHLARAFRSSSHSPNPI